MSVSWKRISVFAGMGSFLGFLTAILLYEPLERMNMVYLIYVGFILGALAGLKGKEFEGFNASAFAFPLGILSSLLLILLWVPGNAGMTPLYLVLGLTLGVMMFIRPSSLSDVVVVPMTYLGGFVLVILAMKGYSPLADNEFAIPIMFQVSGSATGLAFFGSLARWGYGFARRMAEEKVGRGNV